MREISAVHYTSEPRMQIAAIDENKRASRKRGRAHLSAENAKTPVHSRLASRIFASRICDQ